MEKSITNSPGKPNRKKKKRERKEETSHGILIIVCEAKTKKSPLSSFHTFSKPIPPPIVDTKERKDNAYLISEYQFYFTATFHKT